MASPIGHLAAGAAVWYALRPSSDGDDEQRVWRSRVMLAAAAVFSLLPDGDSALGILFGDFGRYHNNWTHSLFWVPLVAAIGAGILRTVARIRWRDGFALAAICLLLHDLVDFATVGRGVMLFWPVTSARFQSPVLLFYGLHWSRPWNHPSHLITLINELAWIGLVGSVLSLFPLRRRSAPFAASNVRLGVSNAAAPISMGASSRSENAL